MDRIARSESSGGQIWQGGISDLQRVDDFDVLVLCAEELQPSSADAWGKLEVIAAPNDDGPPLTRKQVEIATKAARQVANAYRQGKKVLVTCMQGRNRSGFVTALSLCLAYGMPGRRAIRIVRRKRTEAPALTNPHFVDFLMKVPARE